MDTNTKCTGNCMNCIPLQRGFCASQLAYNNMRAIEALSKEISSLGKKMESIQSNEALLFNPTVYGNGTEKTKAHKGDGAEE